MVISDPINCGGAGASGSVSLSLIFFYGIPIMFLWNGPVKRHIQMTLCLRGTDNCELFRDVVSHLTKFFPWLMTILGYLAMPLALITKCDDSHTVFIIYFLSDLKAH